MHMNLKLIVSGSDLSQQEPIQCCHSSDQLNWIDHEDHSSRWLYDSCWIKLKITIDSIWFSSDHADVHSDTDENDNFD